ncbi:hypothetical protein Q664_48650 [Archangium violaceum Cb vi76]|uniref:Uncharacterized protein n=1 Tax=Archangium violaceum Cb vi76 TaxID=1406225 RepID=A0A084SFT5_9BACT|nr:hypothetical protein Q664_48650 [Archangium violaceum Cb vi76]
MLVGMDSFNVEKVFVREKEAKAFPLTFLGQLQTRFERNMFEQGVNHRYRSELWRDNERAYRDTLRKKTYESYREYREHPLRQTVEAFHAAEQALCPDKDFNPRKFSWRTSSRVPPSPPSWTLPSLLYFVSLQEEHFAFEGPVGTRQERAFSPAVLARRGGRLAPAAGAAPGPRARRHRGTRGLHEDAGRRYGPPLLRTGPGGP